MMRGVILGDGPMGRAVAAALAAESDWAAEVRGRPVSPSGHEFPILARADVVFDFSRGGEVAANLRRALDAGCTAFVIGTTGWDADRELVDAWLHDRGAAGVASANFSLGVALFTQLIESATRLFGPLDTFDPYLMEWHRRGKADRPSGTAKELTRRILAAHPRKQRPAESGRLGSAAPDELEVAVIRAGSSPGMHLVAFDSPGETVELRLTARDRSAYADGAVAAARWVVVGNRAPGLHPFDAVVADLTAEHAAHTFPVPV